MTRGVEPPKGASASDAPGNREPVAESQPNSSPSVIEIAGGLDAPARARRLVRARLNGEPNGLREDDIALIVSELVTNSVVHAGVDSSRQLRITLVRLKGRVRLTVTDPGSDTEPRLCYRDAQSGGLGLRIVEELSAAWGTVREPAGTTHVWCDIPSAHELT